jgi:mRNA-degrading endonuclease RelE of RelBE toxin-antitoxin system
VKLGSIRPAKSGGPFERSLAALGRRYPNTRVDVDRDLSAMVGRDLPAPPTLSLVPGVGRTVLKIRVASSDMQRGRSGGFRVLLAHRGNDEWSPILVYAKADREDVPRSEVLKAALEEEAPALTRG